MQRSTIAVTAIDIMLVIAATWAFVERARMAMHVAFAAEQTDIFTQMTEKALDAFNESPPDVVSAVEHLEYLHNYYRSGTKQSRSSQLDRIVERCRSTAEQHIIGMLSVATDEHLGDDVEVWIDRYGNPRP